MSEVVIRKLEKAAYSYSNSGYADYSVFYTNYTVGKRHIFYYVGSNVANR